MELFTGGEDLQQRQKRLSISGQLEGSSRTTNSTKHRATPPPPPSVIKGTHKQVVANNDGSAGNLDTNNEVGKSRTFFKRKKDDKQVHFQQNLQKVEEIRTEKNSSLFQQRHSAATASTVRATIHQLAETLTTFGKDGS